MKIYSVAVIVILLIGLSLFYVLNRNGHDRINDSEKPTFKEFMGVNVHNVEVNMNLLTPVFKLVRDYHTIVWILPEKETRRSNYPYSSMDISWHDRSGKVGDFEGVVNFDEIYRGWQDIGFETNVSLMLVQKMSDKWENMDEDSYELGKDFARYFGPSGEGLVTSVEVGNEPVPYWKLTDYERIFQQMAKGIRAGDADLKILTAATQAGKTDEFSVPIDIYKNHSELYDVIKIHSYAFKEMWPTFERSYPEDPSIQSIKTIESTIQWRNRHAPDKEIWITEFGYDSSNKPADPNSEWAQFKVVNDEVQAQWLLRSFLEFSRLDVERAYVYWFNDHDERTFHASSGIMRLNRPKKSFWALKQLQDTLGDFRFNREVVRQLGKKHVYEYVHENDKDRIIWVAWSPTGQLNEMGRGREERITIKAPHKPSEILSMAKEESEPLDAPFSYSNGELTMTISESPVYIIF